MRWFVYAVNFISEWSGKIFSYLWIAAILIAVQEAIRRYVFLSPTAWGMELAIYLCATVYMMGGAYTHYHKRHVCMDIVYCRFSPRVRAMLDMITFPIFCSFIVVLLWSGTHRTWMAILNEQGSGSAWNPIIWPIFLMIPLGAFLVLLQGTVKFIENLAIVRRKQSQ
jgi:TRAP-type mannitol/chloroaromatic compound transport system permease small subunit